MVLTASPKLVMMYNVRVINQGSSTPVNVRAYGSCNYEYINAAFNCSYATYRITADNTISMNAPTTVNIDSSFDKPRFDERITRKGCPQQGSWSASVGCVPRTTEAIGSCARKRQRYYGGGR